MRSKLCKGALYPTWDHFRSMKHLSVQRLAAATCQWPFAHLQVSEPSWPCTPATVS